MWVRGVCIIFDCAPYDVFFCRRSSKKMTKIAALTVKQKKILFKFKKTRENKRPTLTKLANDLALGPSVVRRLLRRGALQRNIRTRQLKDKAINLIERSAKNAVQTFVHLKTKMSLRTTSRVTKPAREARKERRRQQKLANWDSIEASTISSGRLSSSQNLWR